MELTASLIQREHSARAKAALPWIGVRVKIKVEKEIEIRRVRLV